MDKIIRNILWVAQSRSRLRTNFQKKRTGQNLSEAYLGYAEQMEKRSWTSSCDSDRVGKHKLLQDEQEVSNIEIQLGQDDSITDIDHQDNALEGMTDSMHEYPVSAKYECR